MIAFGSLVLSESTTNIACEQLPYVRQGVLQDLVYGLSLRTMKVTEHEANVGHCHQDGAKKATECTLEGSDETCREKEMVEVT